MSVPDFELYSYNVYDNRGKRQRVMLLDPRHELTYNLRRALTNLEFLLFEPEPCEECIKYQAARIAADFINGFGLADYHGGTIRD